MHEFSFSGQKVLKNNKGIVLVFTFAIMLALGGLAFAFLYMASTQTRAAGHSAEDTQALWLAEAGMEKYLYLLKTDSDYRDNYPDLDENLGSGSYLVSAVYSSGSNTYTLTSTGTAGSLSRQISQSAVVTPAPGPYGNAMYVYGHLLNFTDNYATLNGDIVCIGDVTGEENLTINGSLTEYGEGTAPVVDYASYMAIADHVVGGHQTFSAGQTYGAPGSEEVWYVEGRVVIEDNVTIYGSIICPNMTVDGDGAEGLTIAPASGMPAIVGGTYVELNELTDSTITGLLYSGKDLRINKWNNVTLNGTLIADNVAVFQQGNANVTVNVNPDLITNPPPYIDTSGTSGGATISLQGDWVEN